MSSAADRVTSLQEREFLLRRLARRESALELNRDDQSPPRTTALSACDAQQGLTLADPLPEDWMHATLQVHSQVDGVLVSFETRMLGSRQLAFPAAIQRMQRREYFRLVLLPDDEVVCAFQNEAGQWLEWPVADLSLGGVGLQGQVAAYPLIPGTQHRQARLLLTGAATLSVDIRVVACHDVRLASGQVTTRTGCQFMHLDGQQETRIQRYLNVTHVQRNRR